MYLFILAIETLFEIQPRGFPFSLGVIIKSAITTVSLEFQSLMLFSLYTTEHHGFALYVVGEGNSELFMRHIVIDNPLQAI